MTSKVKVECERGGAIESEREKMKTFRKSWDAVRVQQHIQQNCKTNDKQRHSVSEMANQLASVSFRKSVSYSTEWVKKRSSYYRKSYRSIAKIH